MDIALGSGGSSARAPWPITRRLSGEARRDDIHPFRRGNTLRTSSQFSLPHRGQVPRFDRASIVSPISRGILDRWFQCSYDEKANEGYTICETIPEKPRKERDGSHFR